MKIISFLMNLQGNTRIRNSTDHLFRKGRPGLYALSINLYNNLVKKFQLPPNLGITHIADLSYKFIHLE